MKLAYVDLCGFRGFRKHVRIDFADVFTVIDGRNGVGKSTILDAVEFALTGTIAKYGGATADGETVNDYLWWTGEGTLPVERYVEAGFRDGKDVLRLRRTDLAGPDHQAFVTLTTRLYDSESAPRSPIEQLCASSIIRDEHIAALSLDLKETERYARLRDAIGAMDADHWIERGSKLVAAAKARVGTAEGEVSAANEILSVALRRVDELRASVVEDTTLADSVTRLRNFANSQVAIDELTGPVRLRIADKARELELLKELESEWVSTLNEVERLPALREAVRRADDAKKEAEQSLAELTSEYSEKLDPDSFTREARDLLALAALGRHFGLHDGHCPLCGSSRTAEEFQRGLEAAESLARRLDERAAEQEQRARRRAHIDDVLSIATSTLRETSAHLQSSISKIEQLEQRKKAIGLDSNAKVDDVRQQQRELAKDLDSGRNDLRVVETFQQSASLERALRAVGEAKERLNRAEERRGRASRGESYSKALMRAAQRAAGETLDGRLHRVLPLLSELYCRLQPHPVWRNIEYVIRGDVRRFLKLEVGDGLNPQFIFSSGQRRATGLAFLLAVNLSLAWSRWQTILLDDPVQHVDDFRNVHLAEVLSQICATGKQIICSVEDAALAELLCRRLPVDGASDAKRITLGIDGDGALNKISEKTLDKLVVRGLVTDLEHLAG